MDDNQQQAVLQSIAVSSGFINVANPNDRQVAFQVLEDFKKYDGCISVCIGWLHQEGLRFGTADITIPVKLYALTIVDHFLNTSYTKLMENERLQLRHAILTASRQIAPAPIINEARVLGNKIASIIAALMVRDFPQRWTTFFVDVFSPMRQGGLWCNDGGDGVHTMGVKICLTCLRLVTEDTTDSDFNAKISTARRNDVLLGLNEVSSQFLPLLFGILEHYSYLVQTKAKLHNMRLYLRSQGRNLSQMTVDESCMYKVEQNNQSHASNLIQDCLITLAQFSHSMPLDWTFGTGLDFVGGLLHLLREPSVQVEAVVCLENLALRKLDAHQWIKLIRLLPLAVADANGGMNDARDERLLEQQVGGNIEDADPLALQLPYHRALSRMLAHTVSTNISHISTDKNLLNGKSDKFAAMSSFLRLLVDMLHHPCGRICGEQINTWTTLLRDPAIVKTNLISPFAEELMSCYMDHMIKIRWEDVDDHKHPQSDLIEACWDDENEYESWLGEYRSRSAQLFKCLGIVEPAIAASVLSKRTLLLIQQYGDGAPLDRLHPGNNQLTRKSEAVMKFEGLLQPLDSALNGIPSWSMEDDGKNNRSRQSAVRANVRISLSQLSNALVSWDPKYLFLKFRRSQLLEALKHFWVNDPTDLLRGVDALLLYLGAPDDWNQGGNEISGEIVSLRKKSGTSLVAVAKMVPHHLVPWIGPLSDAVRRHLSSNDLLAPNRMLLYEFLSCIATAVENPVTRSSFIADVLSDAMSVLESTEFKQNVASVESYINWLGISEAESNPSSVSNPQHVRDVSSSFQRVFSAFTQILSVGKRCHEAKRKKVGLVPFLVTNPGSPELNFPDEGPVSLQDLAMEDPFVPLWPRILPALLQIMDVTLRLWHPVHQAKLLQNSLQRYALAISDDEAFLSKVHDTNSGGVFGEGGTAGSIVLGVDRRHLNLVPRWSGWFNELRNSCFQMLGLLSGQRALYAPELAAMYPQFVQIVANPDHVRAMENRHLTQYLKQFIEILLLSCPSTLYRTHLAPIVTPLFVHMEHRLKMNWQPVLKPSAETNKRPLTSVDCLSAAALAAQSEKEWYDRYYGRAGVFVGDLDMVTAEAAVDKARVELSRTYSDVLQAGLALKGDWALVLANVAKEEGALKKGETNQLMVGTKGRGDDNELHSNGTSKLPNQSAIDARKLLRINRLCHFFLLEDEQIAGPLLLSIIHSLSYPDAYTVRRCTKICHRVLETVAWSPSYVPLIANQMFSAAVTNIVVEPKWMVGIEWDMINVVRDIFCRLVLGQTLQPGGQGPGLQQAIDPRVPGQFEQAKTAEDPLKGGGILVVPTDIPRQLLAGLPGIGEATVRKFEDDLRRKRSAKDQKDFLRDVLRIAAENSQYLDNGRSDTGVFGRADLKESLLKQKDASGVAVFDLPEKLVTKSMIKKKSSSMQQNQNDAPEGLSAFAI